MKQLVTTVVLPAYNEELTLKETILDFANELPDAYIVIIDNNSKDRTYDIAKNTLETNNLNGTVLFERRQGKGYAIRKAFTEIKSDIFIMADADLTYPAKDVHKLLKPVIEGKADLVVGDRHSEGQYKKENKRTFHDSGNDLVKRLINALFKSNLRDIMSGYRVLNSTFVKNYPIMVSGFELETDMTLHALDKRFNLIEIPIDYSDRPTGSYSKLNTFQDGFRVLLTIFNIFRHYKPLLFFSSFAGAFMLLGLIIGMPVINDYLVYDYVYHVPSAILATGLEIMALMSLIVGLILDSIERNNKQLFEHKIIKFKDMKR